MFGSEDALEARGTAHLYDIYVKISALFKPEEDAYKAARKSGADAAKLERAAYWTKSKTISSRWKTATEKNWPSGTDFAP
jgi:arginyl-tRNA synthetase